MGANCVTSASLGLLLCYKGCNAEKVRNSFVFLPPKPSYVVEADPQDPSRGCIKYTMERLANSRLYRRAADAAEVRYVTTRKGETVPVVWIRPSPGQASSSTSEPPMVLLHCHGNATDIGLMMGPYLELATVLGVEVLGVEYSGYGCSTGEPSSGNNHADLEAAYDLLVASGVPESRIIGYGQSVGSGPVAGLCRSRELGGVVLHSPLLSGIKVIDPHPDRCCRPSCCCFCFDFFKVERCVRQAKCPVFIMHGKRDDVIPFYHGFKLFEAIPPAQKYPAYFPEGGGHNDLPDCDMRAYFEEVYRFLSFVRQRANGVKVDLPSPRSPSRHKKVEPPRIQTTVSAKRRSPQIGEQALERAQSPTSTPSIISRLSACSLRKRPSKLASAEPDCPQTARPSSAPPFRPPERSSGNEAGVGGVPSGSLEVQVGPTDGRYRDARQGFVMAAARGNDPNKVCREDSQEGPILRRS